MVQLRLPLPNPRDQGRLNALRNLLAAITDELRLQAPVAEGIVDFAIDQFPKILRQHTPLTLLSAAINPDKISPYPFRVYDLIQTSGRPDVFPTIGELIKNLNVPVLASPIQGVELIGIDESIVDTPLPHSTLSFLKSVAFRVYQLPNGSPDEAVGPILSKMRMQMHEGETYEAENSLIGYIRNNFVAYTSALTSLAFGRIPFVVLHGPLVRAIGPFSELTFNYETARELLNVDLPEAGEFEVPQGAAKPVIKDDGFTQQNLSFSPKDAINGEKNLRQFNEFCLKRCGKQCVIHDLYEPSARPRDTQGHVTKQMIQERDYPGLCLYLWVLRSLLDLARLAKITVASVIEDVSAATEMTRLILPSLFAISQARSQIERSPLQAALRAANIQYSGQPHQRADLYRQVRDTIVKLGFSDSNLLSNVLAEGQYTAPVQVYRYRLQKDFLRALGGDWLGIRNKFEPVLEALFPSETSPGSHPGYRILMSYARTTPLREPVRVEYFDLPHLAPERVIGPLYLLSLPYQEYGMPIILYYADKLARTPTQVVRTIIEREYWELVLQNRLSDPVSIMRVLGHLNRGYFQREGLQ